MPFPFSFRNYIIPLLSLVAHTSSLIRCHSWFAPILMHWCAIDAGLPRVHVY